VSPFERRAVSWTGTATFLSGVGYLFLKYFVTSDDPFGVVNHPLQPWFLRAHVLASPLLVLAIGSVAVRHVWAHYVSGVKTARRTGILTALVTAPMIATGYLIQVVTSLGWLRALALVHIAAGVVFGVGLAAHQVVLRRQGVRRQSRIMKDTHPAALPPVDYPTIRHRATVDR